MSFLDQDDGEKPNFENSAEFLSYLASPDAQKFFNDINKDIATTTLDDTSINLFLMTNSIMGDLVQLGTQKSLMSFFRETAGLLNARKSKDGFFMNKLGKQEINKNVNYTMDEKAKKQMRS